MILADDGLATGSTMRAAAPAGRRRGAGAIRVAVPVASAEACAELGEVADDHCLLTPEPSSRWTPGSSYFSQALTMCAPR